MPWIPLHQTWQTNLLWLMDSSSQSRIDALNTTTPNLADKPTLASGPPQSIKNGCLVYQFTKLGRWTYFGWWTPLCQSRIDALNTTTPNMADIPTLADGLLQSIKNRCLAYHYTKLGRQTYFGQWTPLSQLRIDALNTSSQNLADNLLWLIDPPR